VFVFFGIKWSTRPVVYVTIQDKEEEVVEKIKYKLLARTRTN
jgi:hypothetical protein